MSFKLFKTPVRPVSTKSEIKSWTLTWGVDYDDLDDGIERRKIFTDLEEAKEYEKALIEAAVFLQIKEWTSTSITEN